MFQSLYMSFCLFNLASEFAAYRFVIEVNLYERRGSGGISGHGSAALGVNDARVAQGVFSLLFVYAVYLNWS